MDDISLEFSEFLFVVVFEEVAPSGSDIRRIITVDYGGKVDPHMPNIAVFSNRGSWG